LTQSPGERELCRLSAMGERQRVCAVPGDRGKFSGSRESDRGSVVNAGFTTSLQRIRPKLSESLINDPLRVNNAVTAEPQSGDSNPIRMFR